VCIVSNFSEGSDGKTFSIYVIFFYFMKASM